MTDLVVETTSLRKVYRSGRRKVVALDGLDLTVPQGGIHGFLGPNGSGKTTTLRLLLGLARASAGEIRLFGRPVPQHLPEVIDRVGAVVEEPRFTPGFSGRRNLRLLAGTLGLDKRVVASALEQVGLTRRAREPYAAYSLGMRQRLAIAAALVKAPDLLLLDEPTNGLDPAGIRDIRHLVRDLADSGVTVLLSSHNLAEVQQVCHSVSIIGAGRLVTTGRVQDLLGEQVSGTRVRVADAGRAMDVLRQSGHDVSVDRDHLVVEGHDHPEELTRVLAEHGLYVSELSEVRPTLESVFLRLTRESGHGPAAPNSEAS